ncbi:uncharacterized protein [Dysidea avara]|uniref:uncharacterized protein n=1 Tax=Dysidea avara TaxID=196820 RepID=UPI0033231C0E
MDKRKIGQEPSDELLSLPIELLIHILSFLTATRDKVKLRYVSRGLRSVTETPSLWREFAWPYYYGSDDGCVNNLLKVCGQHVKQLSFPHHVTPAKLLRMLEYCNNAVDLSLPTTKLNPEQLKTIVLCMRQLQKLDVLWDSNIKQLLELVVVGLKELTIRVKLNQSSLSDASGFCRSVGPWMQYWSSERFIPQNLNVVVVEFPYIYPSLVMLENALLTEWYKIKSNAPVGHTGCLKLYSTFKKPLIMNLALVLPMFQLEYGQSSSLSFVSASSCGLPGWDRDLLLLTDSAYNGRVVCQAVSKLNIKNVNKDYLNEINSLNFVTEFDISFLGVNSEHLEKLSVVCPNLQRLNLKSSRHCLKSLQGLRTIASFCHNLQGINLMGIPVEEVENQTKLWEILSGVKLTHLAVELCVLLPLDKDNKTLKSLFKKFTNLYALESSAAVHCRQCLESFTNDSLSILFNFSSLTHYVYFGFYHRCTTFVRDIVNSCTKLRYLKITQNVNITSLHFMSVLSCNLEQLCIESIDVDLPDDFMSSVSAHGGLVHVVLSVKSVTVEGM